MSSLRIQVRDKIRELVGSIDGVPDGQVFLYRLDKVETTPAASVYLGRMSSEVETMTRDGNDVERDLRIFVDFHLDTKSDDAERDADKVTDGWLCELESLVWQAARDGEFGDGVRIVDLVDAEFAPADRTREKRGDMTAEFRATYDETVSGP